MTGLRITRPQQQPHCQHGWIDRFTVVEPTCVLPCPRFSSRPFDAEDQVLSPVAHVCVSVLPGVLPPPPFSQHLFLLSPPLPLCARVPSFRPLMQPAVPPPLQPLLSRRPPPFSLHHTFAGCKALALPTPRPQLTSPPSSLSPTLASCFLGHRSRPHLMCPVLLRIEASSAEHASSFLERASPPHSLRIPSPIWPTPFPGLNTHPPFINHNHDQNDIPKRLNQITIRWLGIGSTEQYVVGISTREPVTGRSGPGGVSPM